MFLKDTKQKLPKFMETLVELGKKIVDKGLEKTASVKPVFTAHTNRESVVNIGRYTGVVREIQSEQKFDNCIVDGLEMVNKAIAMLPVSAPKVQFLQVDTAQWKLAENGHEFVNEGVIEYQVSFIDKVGSPKSFTVMLPIKEGKVGEPVCAYDSRNREFPLTKEGIDEMVGEVSYDLPYGAELGKGVPKVEKDTTQVSQPSLASRGTAFGIVKQADEKKDENKSEPATAVSPGVLVFDNGGETFDRYTIIFPDGWVVGSSERPNHPQGFWQHSHNTYEDSGTDPEGYVASFGEELDEALGKQIEVSALPEAVQQQIKREMTTAASLKTAASEIKWLDEEGDLGRANRTYQAGEYNGQKFYVYNDQGLYFTLYFSLEDLKAQAHGYDLSDNEAEQEEDIKWFIDQVSDNPEKNASLKTAETTKERARRIEQEHKPTYDKIKENVKEEGKVTMTMDEVADSIGVDHMEGEGFGEAYYDEKEGLPEMERRLKNKKSASLNKKAMKYRGCTIEETGKKRHPYMVIDNSTMAVLGYFDDVKEAKRQIDIWEPREEEASLKHITKTAEPQLNDQVKIKDSDEPATVEQSDPKGQVVKLKFRRRIDENNRYPIPTETDPVLNSQDVEPAYKTVSEDEIEIKDKRVASLKSTATSRSSIREVILNNEYEYNLYQQWLKEHNIDPRQDANDEIGLEQYITEEYFKKAFRNSDMPSLNKKADGNVTINIDKVEISDGDLVMKPRELPEVGQGEKLEMEKADDVEIRDLAMPLAKRAKKIDYDKLVDAVMNDETLYDMALESGVSKEEIGDINSDNFMGFIDDNQDLIADHLKSFGQSAGHYKRAKEEETGMSAKLKRFDRVKLVNVKDDFKGTIVEITETKYPDIDLVVLLDKPLHDEVVMEVHPQEVEALQEEASEEQIERAKKVYDDYKKKDKEREDQFKDDIKMKVEKDEKTASLNKKALELWQPAENYMGKDFSDYYVFLSRNRDSDNLTNSNFDVALAELGGEGKGVQVVSFNHWAVGWVESIMIHKDAKDKLAKAEAMVKQLDNYPVLDDDDYFEREEEDYEQRYKDWGREDAIQVLKEDEDIQDDEIDESSLHRAVIDMYRDGYEVLEGHSDRLKQHYVEALKNFGVANRLTDYTLPGQMDLELKTEGARKGKRTSTPSTVMSERKEHDTYYAGEQYGPNEYGESIASLQNKAKGIDYRTYPKEYDDPDFVPEITYFRCKDCGREVQVYPDLGKKQEYCELCERKHKQANVGGNKMEKKADITKLKYCAEGKCKYFVPMGTKGSIKHMCDLWGVSIDDVAMLDNGVCITKSLAYQSRLPQGEGGTEQFR